MSAQQGQASAAQREEVPPSARGWKKVLPYLGTLLIFGLILWQVPIASVGAALEQVPLLKFLGVFLPFSTVFWVVDSFCLTWVVRRFNAPLRLRDVMPIRASMYLLGLINTNLGQGGVAWYLHRKARIPFFAALSSILFIAFMEVYQLFLFSTLGVIFYQPSSTAQTRIVDALRITYVVAWLAFAAAIIFLAKGRRSDRVRAWIKASRLGSLTGTFFEAQPRDYGIVIALKAPGFLMSLLAQYCTLSLYGIAIPLVKLVLFLPLVFLAAALPIAVAHLGTSQAAWLLFFSGNAPSAKILAYSLAAHFTFMFCNALIGLCFLPRATRELMELDARPG